MLPTDQADQPHSHIFLLTIWREWEDGPWRAALRPPAGGARIGFANMEQLVAFLLGLVERPTHDENKEREVPGTPL